MKTKYYIADYSKSKKGEAFRSKQVNYINSFDKKEEAIKYARQLKGNIEIEEWEVNNRNEPETFLDSYIA